MIDKIWKSAVAKMNISALLREILDNPEYLTDSYHEDMGEVLRARGRELLEGTNR